MKATGVVPQQINGHVLNVAIAVSLHFEKQRAIIRQVIFVNLEFPFYKNKNSTDEVVAGYGPCKAS